MVVQGLGHTLVGTPMFFSAVTQEAIWFAAAGLTMIVLGLLNLGPWPSFSRWLRWSAIGANTAWFALTIALLTTSARWRVMASVACAAACLAS